MTDQPTSAMAPLHLRSRVIQVQGWIRQFVGEGVRMNLQWDRTGGQTFELLGGARDQWTTLNIFGRTGGLRYSAGQSQLPIDEPSVRYEVDGDDVITDLRCRIKGLAKRLSPGDSQTVGASDAVVGFPALTALSGLMTVLSFLSFVWQLIHPTISLTLPGNVGCQAILQGQTLTIDLLRPLPALKIHVVMTFTPSLSRVIVTPDTLRFEFEGSQIREREVPIV